MNKTKTDLEIFADFCRYNSGKSALDSGNAYSRHWEKPAIAADCPPVTLEVYANEVTATIETAYFLAEAFDVDTRLMRNFNRWQEGREGGWFELAARYATNVLKLHLRARDNVYNGENDLSQVYVWEVYTPEDDGGDWICATDAVTILWIHTGCDVRGGYSAPIFCRPRGEYTVPVDTVAEFYVEEARHDGEKLDRDDYQALDEKWQASYSGHPSSQVSRDIKRVFGWTKTATSVCVELTSGHIAKIGASIPYMGG